jgi:hypothetical protein
VLSALSICSVPPCLLAARTGVAVADANWAAPDCSAAMMAAPPATVLTLTFSPCFLKKPCWRAISIGSVCSADGASASVTEVVPPAPAPPPVLLPPPLPQPAVTTSAPTARTPPTRMDTSPRKDTNRPP